MWWPLQEHVFWQKFQQWILKSTGYSLNPIKMNGKLLLLFWGLALKLLCLFLPSLLQWSLKTLISPSFSFPFCLGAQGNVFSNLLHWTQSWFFCLVCKQSYRQYKTGRKFSHSPTSSTFYLLSFILHCSGKWGHKAWHICLNGGNKISLQSNVLLLV